MPWLQMLRGAEIEVELIVFLISFLSEQAAVVHVFYETMSIQKTKDVHMYPVSRKQRFQRRTSAELRTTSNKCVKL